VRFVQDQVALDQDGHLAIGIHHRDVFGLVVQVDVTDLEIHALFEQHEAAALRKGAGRPGVEHHHVVVSNAKKSKNMRGPESASQAWYAWLRPGPRRRSGAPQG